ncbi:hypothetical protein F5I97DRAFT_1932724 [Phlebopus sp. FC_14]|nr:hypothetical protein F5I97DRAFT_1932724 [Phlebopus sp. FC_14]
MSAQEVVAALNIELEADVVSELAENLAAAEEVLSLEEFAARASSSKLALVAVGGTLYAKFSPGPSGSGPIRKSGTGGFTGKVAPSTLKGTYTLDVGRISVKLYQGSTVIWSGAGLQKGLSGKWEIKF